MEEQTTQSRTKKLTDLLQGQLAKIGEQKTYMEIPSTVPTMGGSKKPMPKLNEIDDKSPEFMKAIKDFVANPKGYLLLAGKNGNGKTFSARAIYEHFWHPQGDNQWWNQADLNMKWMDVLAQYKSANYFIQDIVNAPLLVLDDIGTRKPSEGFMDFLYVIADKRYNAKDKCGTIITTNMNAKTLRETFGDAFVSRVASGICVRHDGPDRRCYNF